MNLSQVRIFGATACLFALLFGVLTESRADGRVETYLFVNAEEAIGDPANSDKIPSRMPLSDGELKEAGLAIESEEFVVVTFKNVAAWIQTGVFGSTNWDGTGTFDETNAWHAAGEAFLKARLQLYAFQKAVRRANESAGFLFDEKEIEEKINDKGLLGELSKFSEEKFVGRKFGRTGMLTKKEFVYGSYYLKVSRAAILDLLNPPPIELSFESPVLDESNFSGRDIFVARFIDRRLPIAKTQKKNQERKNYGEYKEGFENAIFELAQEALAQAIVDVNGSLEADNRLKRSAVERLVADLTAKGQDRYQVITMLAIKDQTKNYKIEKQQLWRRGALKNPADSTSSRNTQDLVEITAYFYLNREKIKQLIIPPEVATPLTAVGSLSIKGSPPKVDEDLFVGVYRDQLFRIREDLPTEAGARRAALEVAREELKERALVDAIAEVRTKIKMPIGESEVTRAINSIGKNEPDYINEFAWLTQPEIVSRGATSTAPEQLRVSAYVSINRTNLKNLLLPPIRIETLNLAGARLAESPPSFDPDIYVALYRDLNIDVPADFASRREGRRATLDSTEKNLRAAALSEAATDIRNSLQLPIGDRELKAALAEAVKRETEVITDFRWLGQPRVETRGENSLTPERLLLSAYVAIERNKLKDIIFPPEEAKPVSVSSREIATAVPTFGDNVYVGVFEDWTADVRHDVKDKEGERRAVLNDSMAYLKDLALLEAAKAITTRLAQPIDLTNVERVLQSAANREQRFIKEARFIGQPTVLTRGAYSTAPETLKFSAYIAVDNNALQELLVENRVIAVVGKYRTYVELYWNTKKEIDADAISTLIGTIENGLREEGYEVVEFDRIQGDLANLLTNSDEQAELYSSDELKRFKANMALRNIGTRFENGKRILADYADVLFGVTVNTLDVIGNELVARVTIDATFFTGGEWMKLASFDSAVSVPYSQNDSDLYLRVVKQAGINALAGVKENVQTQLALRKDREELNISQEREFTVVFAGSSKDQFGEIRQQLKNGSRWNYKRADSGSRAIYIGFAGNIDSLSDLIQLYLEGADLDPGPGEYSSGVNRIMFGK